MLVFLVLLCAACLVGVLVGWAWKPKWVASVDNGRINLSAARSSHSTMVLSPAKDFGSTQEEASVALTGRNHFCSLSQPKQENSVVTEEDLKHLIHLVDRKDGGPPWKHVMDRSTPSMSYQACQRDTETGPPQFCSRTVYEDATPELLRDFFWDDEFRLKWDDMMIHAATVEESPTTGAMIVHWIRKFPFFCSDRENIIGRRIWKLGQSYYCVTKGVPCPSVPRHEKARRVDVYYSSWAIQAVASREGNGQLTACEVILFHHEDMGIPSEVVKFGARHGMWRAVKNMERGLRAYQKARASGAPPSQPALMAQVYTKLGPDYLKSSETAQDSPKAEGPSSPEKPPQDLNIPKLLIFAGAVALAFSLERGLLTKAVPLWAARRLGNIGRRL
ncbi:uncharacterized protein LOC127793269 [Diospyros lotus]|uniref:uncharacterized protein LOC127793269 n=1 Tax=Diospyros lotus TaxID=55363 RepID=UPI00224DC033|nr:uncharacterized protein LOC127793269 [Diospyros lotus]